uniref:PDZ and LIM domain protein 2 n=1 Tax=Pelodiscus sinensis TaxID=13735 RepID=K7GJ94_PELSI
MSVAVNLTGPAPWGFRITGGRDFRKPIIVSKVIEHGKAAAGDLRLGDVITSINGESTAGMLNVEAQNKIKQSSGQLQLQAPCSEVASPGLLRGQSVEQGDAAHKQLTREQPVSYLANKPPVPCVLRLFPQPVLPQFPLGRALAAAAHLAGDVCLCLPGVAEATAQGWGGETSLGRCCCSPGGRQSPPCWGLPAPVPLPQAQASCSLCSLDSESAMRRLEEDSEVYKMMQENREVRAAPRQSSTFRMLQVALESDGRDGTTAPFPSQLSPSAHKPVASSVAQKLHVCEKCDTSIRPGGARPRHSSCYVCTDCGLNLRLGGHFWVGEELFCEKHARQRYQGLGKGA